MTLSPEQLKAREGKLTASAVGCLMMGEEEKIMNLWRELVGDPSYKPEDLSNIWPVQLGSITEPLNILWYTKKHAPISRCGEVVVHPRFSWAACTLDGWDTEKNAPVEAKHVGAFVKIEDVIARYQPQLHWIMNCTGSQVAFLSVIQGANEPVVEEIPLDKPYMDELWRRAEAFMSCVWSLTPPIAEKPVLAPVKAEKVYDFRLSNSWVEHAKIWIETKESSDKNKLAEKELKLLVPQDAKRAFGGGIEIKRNKAGSLSLKAATDA